MDGPKRSLVVTSPCCGAARQSRHSLHCQSLEPNELTDRGQRVNSLRICKRLLWRGLQAFALSCKRTVHFHRSRSKFRQTIDPILKDIYPHHSVQFSFSALPRHPDQLRLPLLRHRQISTAGRRPVFASNVLQERFERFRRCVVTDAPFLDCFPERARSEGRQTRAGEGSLDDCADWSDRGVLPSGETSDGKATGLDTHFRRGKSGASWPRSRSSRRKATQASKHWR